MRDHYDFSNAEKNPYINKLPAGKQLKKQITINISEEAIDYFKKLSEETGIPYQTLINLYLTDCARNSFRPQMNWM